VFGNDYPIVAGTKHSNCTYAGDELRTCRFDQALSAGGTYAATLNYRLRPDALAPSREHGEVLWLTAAEFEDFVALLDHRGITIGSPGTGGALELAETPGPLRAGRVQADTDPENNWSSLSVDVQGRNGADLAAVGDTLTGAAGAVVTASVGMTNLGPATLHGGRSGEPLTQFDVVVPAGTTAVDVPDDCAPFDGTDTTGEPGTPGAPQYRCPSSTFILVGATQTIDLKLRIDRVISNASGSVRINAPCECSGWRGDTDARNDLARIWLNRSAGGGGGGGGDDDGGLPITGTATTTLVAVGLVLLALGALGLAATRRRRVRFTA
jgi:LPXTG-motif cell wall-anchored protein